MVNAVHELVNDKTSRGKVLSCVTSCPILLFQTNFAYDMSHPSRLVLFFTKREVVHRFSGTSMHLNLSSISAHKLVLT